MRGQFVEGRLETARGVHGSDLTRRRIELCGGSFLRAAMAVELRWGLDVSSFYSALELELLLLLFCRKGFLAGGHGRGRSLVRSQSGWAPVRDLDSRVIKLGEEAETEARVGRGGMCSSSTNFTLSPRSRTHALQARPQIRTRDHLGCCFNVPLAIVTTRGRVTL